VGISPHICFLLIPLAYKLEFMAKRSKSMQVIAAIVVCMMVASVVVPLLM
tara:strand:- start:102 stop:251 length:150 start_codon:yes stop_codon:yes gene_type:complete